MNEIADNFFDVLNELKTIDKTNAVGETMNSESRSADFTEYNKPITEQDIQQIRAIGRKSINEFTDADIKATQKWAYKFYRQMGTKSPFFRAWFGDWRAYDTKTKVEYVSVSDEKISPGDVSRKGAVNSDTGWKIKVNSDGIDETAHKRGKWAVDYHSLKEINDMIKSAILLDTFAVDKPSKKMGKNAIFVHHLYCQISVEDNNGVAKLYVVEKTMIPKNFISIKLKWYQPIPQTQQKRCPKIPRLIP